MTLPTMRILYIEDDQDEMKRMTEFLAEHAPHMELHTSATRKEYLKELGEHPFDALLASFSLSKTPPSKLLADARERSHDLPVVFIADRDDEETLAETFRPGDADYVIRGKGYLARTLALLEHVIERQQLAANQAQQATLLTEIAHVGEQMRLQLTLSAVLDFVCCSMHQTLGWGQVVLRMRDGSGAFARPVSAEGISTARKEDLLSAPPSPVTEWYRHERFSIGYAYFIPNLRSRTDVECPEEILSALTLDHSEGQEEHQWQADDLLIVPIDGPSGRLGTILVTDPASGQRPTPRDIQGLEILANQAATAIESAYLYRQISQEKGRFQLLNEIGHQVSSSLNLSQVLGDVLSLTTTAMEAERGSILVIEEGQQVTYRILSHELGLEEPIQVVSPVLDDGLSRWVLDHRVGVLLPDVQEDERWYSFPDKRWPSRSVICVPLKVREKVRAVMTITDTRPNHFDGDDLRLAEAIADRVAWAVENAWLYAQTDEALRKRVTELDALNTIAATMSRSLDLDEILKNALNQILTAISIGAGAVHLWESKTRTLNLRAYQGVSAELAACFQQISLRDAALTDKTKGLGKPVLVHLSQSPKTKRQQMAVELGYLTLICIPLQSRGSFLGSILLLSHRELQLGPEMKRLLIGLGHQLGTAVENARLYQTEQERANQLETIHAVTAAASSSLDPREIASMVLERAMQLTGTEIGAAYFQEEAGDLVLASHKGMDAEYVSHVARLGPDNGMVGYVAEEGELTYTTKYSEEDWALPVPLAGIRTAIVVPLRATGRVFGVAFLASTQVRTLAADVLRLLEVIGDEVGVTIQNARLFTNIQKAEEDHRAILDSSIDAIVSGDADRGITVWSAGAEDIFGWSREQALGQSPDLIALKDEGDGSPKTIIDLLHPTAFIRNYVTRAWHKDGHLIDIEISASLLKTLNSGRLGFTAVIRDITARLQRERLLEALNEASTAMAPATTPEAIFNAAAEAFLGLGIECMALTVDADREHLHLAHSTLDPKLLRDIEGLLGSPLSRLSIPIEDNETYSRVVHDRASLISRDPLDPIIRKAIERAEGIEGSLPKSMRRYSAISAPLIVKGTVMGVLSVRSRALQEENVPAITAFAHQLSATWHKAEIFAALEESMQQLQRAQARLVQSEKMSAVGRLVSGVAHELNNPLTAVMGYSQLLESADLNPRARQDLEKIRHAADRCSRIVKDLLTFSQQYRPERVSILVNDLLDQTLAMRSYHLRGQNIRVIREYDMETPPITGDPHRLQEVFVNLLTNAEQSMSEAHSRGVLTVRTSVRTGEPETPPTGQPPALDVPAPALRIEFEDDGKGIPPDVMEHIFDPFFTTREVGQGTGLGLSICYGIIGEHQGRIWAENREEGTGTRFVLELPVPTGERSESPEPAIDEEPRVQETDISLTRGKRILVVDDEEAVASLLRRILERLGCQITTVHSGEEALAHLDAEEFDVIVSDLKMPGLSGQELYAQLNENRPEVAKRFIFVTGDVITPGTGDFIRASGRPSLSKPFTSGEIAVVLQEMLERKDN
ncbi:MAG: GAF domain-containing protein, partial [Chloroflexota bacterium]